MWCACKFLITLNHCPFSLECGAQNTVVARYFTIHVLCWSKPFETSNSKSVLISGCLPECYWLNHWHKADRSTGRMLMGHSVKLAELCTLSLCCLLLLLDREGLQFLCNCSPYANRQLKVLFTKDRNLTHWQMSECVALKDGTAESCIWQYHWSKHAYLMSPMEETEQHCVCLSLSTVDWPQSQKHTGQLQAEFCSRPFFLSECLQLYFIWFR